MPCFCCASKYYLVAGNLLGGELFTPKKQMPGMELRGIVANHQKTAHAVLAAETTPYPWQPGASSAIPSYFSGADPTWGNLRQD